MIKRTVTYKSDCFKVEWRPDSIVWYRQKENFEQREMSEHGLYGSFP